MNSLLLQYAVQPDGVTVVSDLALIASAGGASLAVVTGNAALAQNVATALSAFGPNPNGTPGEVWYDTTFGMPYLENILNRGLTPFAFIRTKIVAIAKSVSGVANAVARLTGPTNRTVSGQVQITSASGETVNTVLTTNLAGALPWYVSAADYTASAPVVLTGGGSVLTGGGVVLIP